MGGSSHHLGGRGGPQRRLHRDTLAPLSLYFYALGLHDELISRAPFYSGCAPLADLPVPKARCFTSWTTWCYSCDQMVILPHLAIANETADFKADSIPFHRQTSDLRMFEHLCAPVCILKHSQTLLPSGIHFIKFVTVN